MSRVNKVLLASLVLLVIASAASYAAVSFGIGIGGRNGGFAVSVGPNYGYYPYGYGGYYYPSYGGYYYPYGGGYYYPYGVYAYPRYGYAPYGGGYVYGGRGGYGHRGGWRR